MKNTIKLDNDFIIRPNNTHGWELVTETEKTRQKGKRKGEKYTTEQIWYYPRLSIALAKYVELSLMSSGDIQELRNKLYDIDNKINSLRNLYVVNGELKEI